jgi:hypothetical protein
MQRGEPKRASIVQEQIAELGLADAHGIRQHGFENWRQLAWRTRDDPQHLRRRRLLLQRLGEFLF